MGMAAKWKFLSGDVNWRDYGGMWYRVVDPSNRIDPQWNCPLNAYHLLKFVNLEDAVGDYDKKKGKYLVIVEVIDLGYDAWRDRIPDALRVVGQTIAGIKMLPMVEREKMILEAMEAYSGGDKVFSNIGNNARALMTEAMKRG